jgi:hypothetical protein
MPIRHLSSKGEVSPSTPAYSTPKGFAMSKYVQARFESYMPQKARNAVDHDFRKKAPDYLRNEYRHNSFSNYIFGMESPSGVKQAMHRDRETANKAFRKKNGRNMRANRDSSYLAAVITLSNTITEELEQGKITEAELNATFEQAAERMRLEISEVCGEDIQMYYGTVHYDEKTPHLHLAFKNRTVNGESVFHLLKQNGYFSRVQDTVGEEFQHLGYERGVKKSETRAKHLNIRKMHEAEINTLKEQIKQLQAEKKDIQEQNRKLVKEKEKNRAEIEQNNKAKRELQDQINELKKRKRGLKASEEKIEERSKKIAGNIIQKNKKLIGFNSTQAEEDMANELKKAYLRNLEKAEAHDNMIKDMRELVETTEGLQEENMKLETEKAEAERKRNETERRIIDVEAENIKLRRENRRLLEKYEPETIENELIDCVEKKQAEIMERFRKNEDRARLNCPYLSRQLFHPSSFNHLRPLVPYRTGIHSLVCRSPVRREAGCSCRRSRIA